MNKFYFFISILLFLSLSVYLLYLKKLNSPRTIIENSENYNQQLLVKDKKLFVELADTEEKRQRGLSGREFLAPENGMLFIFPTPIETSFWMPDMNFPIDIIFIKDNQIVKIYSSVPNFPKNYPKENLPLYQSEEPIDMVLETNANWCQQNNITIGDEISLSPPFPKGD